MFVGDRWIVRGPREYIPPINVEVLQRRKTLALDDNEGIYVRNIKTGRVRAVIGSTYMLTPDEELWQKELPPDIELFLKRDSLADRLARGKEADGKATTGKREKWKLVSYHVPQNEALQVYDYKAKKSRIIFGPDIVMLEPDEHFTYINRSGSMLMSRVLAGISNLSLCRPKTDE